MPESFFNQTMSLTTAAMRLGISPPTLRKLVKLKRISYYAIGSRSRFTEEGIQKYIKDNHHDPKPESDKKFPG